MNPLDNIEVRKQNAVGNGYGEWMRAVDLKGDVGDKVRGHIMEEGKPDGVVEVNFRRYMWRAISVRPSDTVA